MSRARNKSNTVAWGNVIAVVDHCAGCTSMSDRQLYSFFSLTSSMESSLKALCMARKEYPALCKKLLQLESCHDDDFDNGQHAVPYKLQHGGSSLHKLNVTVRIA